MIAFVKPLRLGLVDRRWHNACAEYAAQPQKTKNDQHSGLDEQIASGGSNSMRRREMRLFSVFRLPHRAQFVKIALGELRSEYREEAIFPRA